MRVLIFVFLFVFHLAALGNVVLIDVRTAGEFSEEHAKGALNIDIMAEDFEKKISSLDKNGDYVVYCKAGGRSAKAMDKMKALGFKKIKNLETVEKAIKAYGKEL